MDRESRIKDVMSKQFHEKRKSRLSTQTANSSAFPISNFMMVKEDLSFRRRSEFSSMTANRDEKDDEIISFTSDSSNDSNYENVNHANSTHIADDKLESSFQKVILDTKQKKVIIVREGKVS